MYKKILFEDETNQIVLNTYDNRFYVCEKKKEEEPYKFEELQSFEKYNEAEGWMKKRKEKKIKGLFKKKEPIPALCPSFDFCNIDNLNVKITSIDPTSSYLECWISYGKTKRKMGIGSLLKDTKENLEIVKKIEKLEKEVECLEEKKEKFDEKELKEYFKDE